VEVFGYGYRGVPDDEATLFEPGFNGIPGLIGAFEALIVIVGERGASHVFQNRDRDAAVMHQVVAVGLSAHDQNL
jgi:hypothetical protein